MHNNLRIFNENSRDSEGFAFAVIASGVIGLVLLIPFFGFWLADGKFLVALPFILPLLFSVSMIIGVWTHVSIRMESINLAAYNRYESLSKETKQRLGNLSVQFFIDLNHNDAIKINDKMQGLLDAERAHSEAIKMKDSRVDDVLGTIVNETRILRETAKEMTELR
jgi:hypothetical protein